MSAFRDIALKAGVSVKTVPRVLNSVPMVGADTRARVENGNESAAFGVRRQETA